MRVSLGQAAQLPPIVLWDGTIIDNPSATRATAAQCQPYQCGIDNGNIEALIWCAQSGQVGAFGCGDVECSPYLALMGCAAPAVAGPAPPTALPIQPQLPTQPTIQPQLPVLTPQNITQPLPDIAGTLAPIPPPVPSYSLWCDLNAAIAANPVMAVAILAGGVFLLWPKGKKR